MVIGSDVVRRWRAALLAVLAIAGPARRACEGYAGAARRAAGEPRPVLRARRRRPRAAGDPVIRLRRGDRRQRPNPVMNNYAKAAARAGAYAVIVDGIGARGHRPRQGDPLGLHPRAAARRRAGRRHPRRRGAGPAPLGATASPAVILGGWSHGAWTVHGAALRRPRREDRRQPAGGGPSGALRPDAVVLYYPYCGLIGRTNKFPKWKFKGPLLLVTAERDTSARPRSACRWSRRRSADPLRCAASTSRA
jgi:hypothetical protein